MYEGLNVIHETHLISYLGDVCQYKKCHFDLLCEPLAVSHAARSPLACARELNPKWLHVPYIKVNYIGCETTTPDPYKELYTSFNVLFGIKYFILRYN